MQQNRTIDKATLDETLERYAQRRKTPVNVRLATEAKTKVTAEEVLEYQRYVHDATQTIVQKAANKAVDAKVHCFVMSFAVGEMDILQYNQEKWGHPIFEYSVKVTNGNEDYYEPEREPFPTNPWIPLAEANKIVAVINSALERFVTIPALELAAQGTLDVGSMAVMTNGFHYFYDCVSMYRFGDPINWMPRRII